MTPRTSTKTGRTPWWEEQETPATSFAELLPLIAREAIERLMGDRLDREIERQWDFLQSKGLTSGDCETMQLFTDHVQREAVKIAVLVGYALGRTDHGLGSYEDWMLRALSAAGLDGYQIESTWGGPSVDQEGAGS